MKLKRINCCICKSTDIEIIGSIKKMPVCHSIVSDPLFNYQDLIYDLCKTCNNVQIRNLIPLSELYSTNHNIDVVGVTWQNHYKEFSKYILKNSVSRVYLEIGDPSAKLLNYLHDDINSWTIIEPNPNLSIKYEKLNVIKNFFTSDLVETIKDQYDVIVASHFFEHLYDPIEFLQTVFNMLPVNGKLILSIPNFDYFFKTNSLPIFGMNFEHTFFIDLSTLKNLFVNNGFIIDNLSYYQNHSIFITVAKTTNKRNIIYKSRKNIHYKYSKLLSSITDKITSINNKYDNVYLYGAHYNTQLILNMGLTVNVINILDNSISKQHKYLYGTNIRILKPDIISGHIKPVVIIPLKMYSKEICKNLKKINKSVILEII